MPPNNQVAVVSATARSNIFFLPCLTQPRIAKTPPNSLYLRVAQNLSKSHNVIKSNLLKAKVQSIAQDSENVALKRGKNSTEID